MVEPAATGVGSEEARIAAPHLLQNLVPGTMLVPQELQNAIDHLMPCKLRAVGASIPQIDWINAVCDYFSREPSQEH